MSKIKNNLAYIAVPEYQKRGAVHYHVVLFNIPILKDPHKVLTEIWGQGFIFNESTKNLEHLANYISKYIQKDMGEKHKKFAKRFYSSRNLKKPVVIRNPESIEELNKKIDVTQCVIKKAEYTTPDGKNVKQVDMIFPDGFQVDSLLKT